MPFVLTMPKLSPTMEGGTLVKWCVKEGDYVQSGDLLFEVATDKATVEHEALDGGYLKKILVQEGGDALVNQPIAIFTETEEESIEGYHVETPPSPDKEVKETPTQEVVTEKSQQEHMQEARMNQPSFQPSPPLEDYTFEYPRGSIPERAKASPLAKKLAQEKGIDLTSVRGSGPDERVMSRDLDLGQPDLPVRFGCKPTPTIKPGTYEEETPSQMRRVIGERLQASKTFIPHFYVQQDVNMEPLMMVREQLKGGGIKITVNDFVMRAAALALSHHPTVNSGFDSVTGKIIRFKTIDISLAVSIEAGLITPIIRHTNYKNLSEISSEVKMLASLAKGGKLSPHQYQGGSFTISNLGMFGIHDFQAVINPPQASILAVGGIRECPVVKDHNVVPGKLMTLSLSSDHRVVDGADGARFIKTIQRYLENPALLLI